MSVTPRDLARAEAFGRLAAREHLGVRSCPYEANGTPDERVMAARFVAAYVRAGGQINVQYEEGNSLPEKEIRARGGAKRWRTVKLPGGRTLRVAVVRKPGKRGGHTVAGPVHEPKRNS
jgi:hypothetical protein